MIFEWDDAKELANIEKHGVNFKIAEKAFFDAKRITTVDNGHSTAKETRYYCFGRVDERIMTVRFTVRKGRIRILGAGYWRKGRAFYEKQNGIQ